MDTLGYFRQAIDTLHAFTRKIAHCLDMICIAIDSQEMLHACTVKTHGCNWILLCMYGNDPYTTLAKRHTDT